MIPALNGVWKALETVQRLHEAREAAKTIGGADYLTHVEIYKQRIRSQMDDTAEKEVLPAAMEQIKKCGGSAIVIMWFCAAAVEMIEQKKP